MSTSAAVQTIWAELLVGTLADAGVTTCVVSPGSRSTPITAALAADGRFALPTIIDERAAAFYALGVARATGQTVALVCTSGSAAAHYLPAFVEASHANVPLVAITTDRPPELQHCGASQTIDQTRIYGAFARAAFDVGAPVGSIGALRALRRTVIQAIAAARGPRPGPVQLEVPLRKPLEPTAPITDDDHQLAAAATALRGPIRVPAPQLVADPAALAQLAARIAAEPRGIVVAGAQPIAFARARTAAFELCRRAGYPLLAEAGSQLRFAPRPGVAAIDRFDLALAAGIAPEPALVIQLGQEPVAAAWPRAFPDAERWVLADCDWLDPDGRAHVAIGDVHASLEILAKLAPRPNNRATIDWTGAWLAAEQRAAAAIEAAGAAHPHNEGDALRAAVAAAPAGALIQIGNSLPIRVVDHTCTGGDRLVITQRGAAGIDGLIASATGATHAAPTLLILGDVSFAHDLGSLLVARTAAAPLAIVVIDNAGGRIFGGLPYAQHAAARASDAFAKHWLAAPELDPVAVATALGLHATRADSPAALAQAVAAAFARPGATVIHAPVAPTGARDLRATAIARLQDAAQGART